jgi:hypothetical protein
MRDVDGRVDRLRIDLDHLPRVLEALDTTASSPREDLALEIGSDDDVVDLTVGRRRRHAAVGSGSAPAAGELGAGESGVPAWGSMEPATVDLNGTDLNGTGQNGAGQNGAGQNGAGQNGAEGAAAALGGPRTDEVQVR